MAEDPQNRVKEVLSEVLAPLVEQDGGKLYLVDLSDDAISLHLAGTYSGCPGTPIVIEHVLRPALDSVAGDHAVDVSCGWRVPEGAVRLKARGG
jgi:Fe-S cluster biogenesis protein NfuA